MVYINELGNYKDKEIALHGWVYSLRSSGKIRFLLLRDGTGICQCVFLTAKCGQANFDKFQELTQESTVKVTGIVKEDKRSPGDFELSVTKLDILSITKDYPITPKEHGVEFLMDHRHLWLRSKRQHSIIKIRACVVSAIREFFNDRNFTLVDAPIFTPNACEGTSELFKTQYFDEESYLSQSGQLYMEAAAAAFGKVYCLGPTFRAEKSKTRRHLIEFWMLEPEVAFLDHIGNMDLAETMLKHILTKVLQSCSRELAALERNTDNLQNYLNADFERVSYKRACEIIQDKLPEFKPGSRFGAKDETLIGEYFGKPVFIHNYPSNITPFYMKKDLSKKETKNCDLIAPEGYGELLGGSQREDDLDVLLKSIEDHKLSLKHFAWYIDLRKYGSFVSSGFGLGIERTVAWICGLSHVRETIPFARMYGRNYP